MQMRNLGRAVLFLIVFGLTLSQAASVEATVSTKEVVEGNAVELRIKAVGQSVVFPHIVDINGVPVVGSSKQNSMQFTSINGKSSSQKSSILTLSFIPQRDMTIPPYRVTIDGKEYKTEPIAIKVVKSKAPQIQSSDKFSLAMIAQKQKVLVGEPFLVTIFFSVEQHVRLADADYKRPAFKGFFVKEIKEPKTYQKGEYVVQELRYLLTPKKEGNITIEPARVKVGVQDSSRRDIFGRFFGELHWTPLVSKPLNIEVKPLPQQTDLVGNFTIDTTIDTQRVKANKPVNLVVKIEGEGSLEDFDLPEYEIDGVTLYSDDAKVESRLVGGKLVSSYSKSFVFISDHSFTIPSRSFTTYNYKRGKVEVLKVRSYDIEVEETTALAPVGVQSGTPLVQTKNQESLIQKETIPTTETTGMAWWMLIVSFFAGALVTLLGLKWVPGWRFRRDKSPFKESEALKILYPHTNSDREVEAMVRKLYARKNGDKSVVIDKKVLKEMVKRFRE